MDYVTWVAAAEVEGITKDADVVHVTLGAAYTDTPRRAKPRRRTAPLCGRGFRNRPLSPKESALNGVNAQRAAADKKAAPARGCRSRGERDPCGGGVAS